MTGKQLWKHNRWPSFLQNIFNSASVLPAALGGAAIYNHTVLSAQNMPKILNLQSVEIAPPTGESSHKYKMDSREIWMEPMVSVVW